MGKGRSYGKYQSLDKVMNSLENKLYDSYYEKKKPISIELTRILSQLNKIAPDKDIEYTKMDADIDLYEEYQQFCQDYNEKLKDIADVKKAEFSTLMQILGQRIALSVKEQVGQKIKIIPKGKRKGQTSIKNF